VCVGRRTSQSQTNGVDADGRRRRVDSHLPSTTAPGSLDTGRPYLTLDLSSDRVKDTLGHAARPVQIICNAHNICQLTESEVRAVTGGKAKFFLKIKRQQRNRMF